MWSSGSVFDPGGVSLNARKKLLAFVFSTRLTYIPDVMCLIIKAGLVVQRDVFLTLMRVIRVVYLPRIADKGPVYLLILC